MVRAIQLFFAILIIVAAVVGWQAVYIVDVTQQAVVTRLGAPIRTINAFGDAESGPGLQFKRPFTDQVVLFEKRNIGFDIPTEEIQAAGQERLIVDAFARYRITDPLRFYQSVRDQAGLESRLEPIMDASLRGVLGGVDPNDIISERRSELMRAIQEQATLQARGRAAGEEVDVVNNEDLGIEIIDVRIRRADLPNQNAERVYTRMETERAQAAALIRAQGEERARTIRAEADRNVQEILAEANQTSLTIRGEADAARNAVYADAFSRDTEFFDFYRSMEAYQRAFGGGVEGDEATTDGETTLLLSPNSEFFQYFRDELGGN
ncbi:MAG: protease modulator HflC [Maricaulaceae bacterium]|jgi:membrane protease subunit HflC